MKQLIIFLLLFISVTAAEAQFPDFGTSVDSVLRFMDGKYTNISIDSLNPVDPMTHQDYCHTHYVFAPVAFGKLTGELYYCFDNEGKTTLYKWEIYKEGEIYEWSPFVKAEKSLQKKISGSPDSNDFNSLAKIITEHYGKSTKKEIHGKDDLECTWDIHKVFGVALGSTYRMLRLYKGGLYYQAQFVP